MRRSIYFLLTVGCASWFLPACSSASKTSGVYRSSVPAAPGPPAYPTYPPAVVPGAAPPGDSYGGVPVAKAPGSYSDSVKMESKTAGVAMESEEVTVVASSDDSAGAAGGGSTGNSTPKPVTAATVEPNQNEMFDIEARLSIEVEKVGDAAAKVREIAKKHGGQVVADTVNDDAGSSAASFTLRVPSKDSDGFINDIGGIGVVRNRQITARDIGKEFHDAQIYLNNLQVTLKRYEEILAKATDVNSILQIEREMTRIRGEIDRVKGDLRWMKDRAARATIYITIFTSRPDSTPIFDPKAKIYPGVRAVHFADFRGAAGDYGYLGFGLSIAASRYFSLDIDGMRKLGNPGQGLDAFMITIGGEFYSDFLGAGRRSYLNPYIGWRIGYSRIATNSDPRDEVLVGGTLGFELYKTKFFRFDAQSRFLGFFGNKENGGHFGIQSGLQMHVAF
jgi:hypothetical protein